jgi:hypothetical protein
MFCEIPCQLRRFEQKAKLLSYVYETPILGVLPLLESRKKPRLRS